MERAWGNLKGGRFGRGGGNEANFAQLYSSPAGRACVSLWPRTQRSKLQGTEMLGDKAQRGQHAGLGGAASFSPPSPTLPQPLPQPLEKALIPSCLQEVWGHLNASGHSSGVLTFLSDLGLVT